MSTETRGTALDGGTTEKAASGDEGRTAADALMRFSLFCIGLTGALESSPNPWLAGIVFGVGVTLTVQNAWRAYSSTSSPATPSAPAHTQEENP